MQIRVCSSKNVGVAGYAEAFWTVQSDLQTSELASYFVNEALGFAKRFLEYKKKHKEYKNPD